MLWVQKRNHSNGATMTLKLLRNATKIGCEKQIYRE